MRSYRDDGWLTVLGLILVFLIVSIVLTWVLRNHGIDSCKARGGTPITRSWLSQEAWDVGCINPPPKGRS